MAGRNREPPFETVWEGKYDARGKRSKPSLPEPAGLRTVEGRGQASPNRLVQGDNLETGAALLSKLRGKVQLIYIDPPFNLGRDFTARLEVAGAPPLDVPAYSDTWGPGEASFAHMLWQRLTLAREMLASDGSIFVHCNDHTSPLIRGLLDDVFGAEHFLNEIVWHYTGGGRSRNAFSNKHDTIFWYAKGRKHTFNIDAVREPYKTTSGYAKGGIVSRAGKRYLPHPGGTPVDDVWDIPMVNPMAGERTPYPTQKPMRLLERIVMAASNEGDMVADLFAGSGTTALAAHKLGRRWTLFERSALGVSIARQRLLECDAHFSLVEHVASKTASDRSARACVDIQQGRLSLREFSAKTGMKIPKTVTSVANWGIGVEHQEGKLDLLRWATGSKPIEISTFQKPQKSVRIVIYDAVGHRWVAPLELQEKSPIRIELRRYSQG